MNTRTIQPPVSAQKNQWLKTYYFSRAAFSIAWVAAVFSIGKSVPAAAIALLLAYPAWDALANLVDARRNGGLGKNITQALNAAVSAITTIAVALALGTSMHAVLVVFGVWAALSGLFQLATGVRRWRQYGAQWAMILSGAQSALAGAHFIQLGSGLVASSVTDIAPYAAFGAFYFLVSALLLTFSDLRSRKLALSRS